MERGFTLMEILVSMLILSMIIIGVLGILNIADKPYLYQYETGLLSLQQEARRAMDGMIREIRQSRTGSISIPSLNYPTLSSVQFAPLTYPNPIIYYLSNNQINRVICGDASCTTVGTPRILANNINSLIFTCVGGTTGCADARVVQIQINTTENIRNRRLCFPISNSPDSCDQFLTERVRIRN